MGGGGGGGTCRCRCKSARLSQPATRIIEVFSYVPSLPSLASNSVALQLLRKRDHPHPVLVPTRHRCSLASLVAALAAAVIAALQSLCLAFLASAISVVQQRPWQCSKTASLFITQVAEVLTGMASNEHFLSMQYKKAIVRTVT